MIRKRIVLNDQNNCCNGCGLDTWRGKPIALELEHKDGDRNNNKRENLEALCPNCHSLTETWRGRNNKKKVTDDEMRDAIRSTTSLRKALVLLGMADKGGNYRRITRLADEMNIKRTRPRKYDDQSRAIKRAILDLNQGPEN